MLTKTTKLFTLTTVNYWMRSSINNRLVQQQQIINNMQTVH